MIIEIFLEYSIGFPITLICSESLMFFCISKDSDLWSYLISTLMDMIIPKKNIDGSRSCWYINKNTNKIETVKNNLKDVITGSLTK